MVEVFAVIGGVLLTLFPASLFLAYQVGRSKGIDQAHDAMDKMIEKSFGKNHRG